MPPEEGLSPRVRGNPPQRHHPAAGNGSIPACAGEPVDLTPYVAECTVYPRVCGGTGGEFKTFDPDPGLSPRVRGNHESGRWGTAQLGSIPACAGEPARPVRGGRLYSVYPRVCGGTLLIGGAVIYLLGLSPRVRGNLRQYMSRRYEERSIPACAGEPIATLAVEIVVGVYPRVCGGTPTSTRPT